MKDIDICYGFYASHLGLTDFYEESKQKLKEALASGEDFDTGWWGCKKEIRYARIRRESGKITVQVSCHMDDLWEEDALIYDALSEECNIEDELPDEIIDSIRSEAIEVGIDSETETSETFPACDDNDANFNTIMETIERLEAKCEAENDDMYKRLRDIVADHVEYMRSAQ